MNPDSKYSEIITKGAGLSLLINKVDDLLFNGEVFIDFGINPDNLVSESVDFILTIETFNEKNFFLKRDILDPRQTYYHRWRLESFDIGSLSSKNFNNKNLIWT